jgi:hypothetical protein
MKPKGAASGTLDSKDGLLFIPSEPDKQAQEQVLWSIDNRNEGDCCDFEPLSRKWPITCQVMIDMTRTHPCSWILTSLDCHGNPKQVGGDEFYIAFTADLPAEEKYSPQGCHPYSAVALVADLQDGRYRLDFSATPTSPYPPEITKSGGTLTIYFQYSCGIGKMAPPSKHSWRNGGYTHRKYETHLAPHSCPTIRPFCIPNNQLKIKDHTNTPFHSLDDTIDLSRFDLIVAFGDSTMEQFVRQRPNKKGKYYFQNNISFAEKLTVGLNSKSVNTLLKMLDQSHGHLLRRDSSRCGSEQRKAVLLGSCMWDILDSKDTRQGTDYEDHKQACQYYIQTIRQRYPDVTILWKSPTAVHIHWVELDRLVVSKLEEAALFGIERLRYMSASRSKTLYQIQKQIILQEQQKDDEVFLLDLYEATYLSADWLFPSDGRHYRPDLNRFMLQWFYRPSPSTPANDDEEEIHESSTSHDSNNTPDANVNRAMAPKISSDDKGGLLLKIPKPYFIDPTMRGA